MKQTEAERAYQRQYYLDHAEARKASQRQRYANMTAEQRKARCVYERQRYQKKTQAKLAEALLAAE